MRLNCNDWKTFWRNQRLQKCPNCQVMAIFAKSPKPAFFEKVETGDQGKFFKNRPKRCPSWKGPKVHWRKWHYPLISMQKKCKNSTTFWRIKRLQMCPNGQVIAIFAKSPKPAFSEKVQRGHQGKFFKNRPKGCPRWKGPKALWRKWHYPLVSMHLKCKDWKGFWCKRRLKKCPNGQVMAIFARSPITRIFWKSAKGGPSQIFKKSPRK